MNGSAPLSASSDAGLLEPIPSLVSFACPQCHGGLVEDATTVTCTACGRRYPRMDSAYADFAGHETVFEDWWMASPDVRQAWMEHEAPREEEFQRGVAARYLLPLLARLHLPPGRSTVLSAACGLAADVDALNAAGYPSWGIDCGNRVLRWSERRSQARLARADVSGLPFPDGSFDLVMALDVLEHIGVVGDTTTVAPDYHERRVQALRSLVRVTKPGGYLLLSGVNREFPFDMFHTQKSRGVRVHSPREKFSLSCDDYRQLAQATGLVEWVRPLPLRGFFSWTNLRHHRAVRPLLPLFDWALGGLPAGFYGSFLSFFAIVLVRRCELTLSPAAARRENGITSVS